MDIKRDRRLTALAVLLVLSGCLLSLAAAQALRPAAVQADSVPPGVHLSPAPSPGSGGEGKLIALTFDDGPRRSTTVPLLDGLKRRGVQCTFFLIGERLEGCEDILARMAAEGHQVGIHTYDHVRLTGLSRADFDAQVQRTRALLRSALGPCDFLLRPPYGMVDEGVKVMADAPIILWSIDPEDWKDQNAAREVAHIVSEARDGSIILMHDIFPASVEAALQVVDRLHAQGYLFCTVEDLFAARQIHLAPGQVYWNAYP